MEPASHTDPLEDALSQGSQRVAQVASLAAAMAQVVMQRRMLADARRSFGQDRNSLRVLTDQQRLLHQQARLAWTPALDPQWLASADLIKLARAWAAAAAHADADPSAATAQRRCEERLRSLHPYAMAYYDHLRGRGLNALDAMREAAPLFAHPATARAGDPGTARRALGPGDGTDPVLITEPGPDGPAGTADVPDDAARAELRGQQIIDRLQARAHGAGRPELGPDEIAIVLEATTNLPGDIIDRLAQQAGHQARTRGPEQRAATAEGDRVAEPGAAADIHAAADLAATPALDERTVNLTVAQTASVAANSARARAAGGRSPAQLAAQSFPLTAAEALRVAATKGRRPSAAPAHNHGIHKARRAGRAL